MTQNVTLSELSRKELEDRKASLEYDLWRKEISDNFFFTSGLRDRLLTELNAIKTELSSRS